MDAAELVAAVAAAVAAVAVVRVAAVGPERLAGRVAATSFGHFGDQ